MKITGYIIDGQTLGTTLLMWEDDDLGGNDPFKSEENVSIGYEDISSIITWDNFGNGVGSLYSEIRDEIKIFYEATTFSSLSDIEKEIVSRWMVATKSERDSIKSNKEQKIDASNLSNHLLSETLTEKIILDTEDGSDNTSLLEGIYSIFGSNYQYISSESESSTTSSTWQQKLRLTTSDLLGTYRVTWYGEITNSSDKEESGFRVSVNGSVVSQVYIEPENKNEFLSQSGFYVSELTGVTNIDIDFNEYSKGTSTIRRCRLEIMRIS